MTSYAYGGSQGLDTLPGSGPGLWRARALQYVTLEGSGASQYSELSGWVQFRVGDPETAMNRIQDLSSLVQVIDADNAFERPAGQRSRSFTNVPLRSVVGEELGTRLESD